MESKYEILVWYSWGRAAALGGNCKGAYLLAIFTRFGGFIGATGIKGMVFTTGVTGVAAPRVLVKGICAVGEDVKGGL